MAVRAADYEVRPEFSGLPQDRFERRSLDEECLRRKPLAAQPLRMLLQRPVFLVEKVRHVVANRLRSRIVADKRRVGGRNVKERQGRTPAVGGIAGNPLQSPFFFAMTLTSARPPRGDALVPG